jgi:hypothetical protein
MVALMADQPIKQRPPGSDEWLRQYTLPEEYIIRHFPRNRGGYHRWFESANVVDLVRVRRERAKQQQKTRSYDPSK